MSEVNVYKPENLRELISVYNSQPGSILFAGGTRVMLDVNTSGLGKGYSGKSKGVLQNASNVLISLEKVDELKRIIRRERYLEIGSAVTLQQIAGIGSRVVPAVLHRAISGVGYKSVRSTATLGGGLCTASLDYPPLTALVSLEARIEIRGKARSRWVPVEDFIVEEGVTQLAVNEILTRIRIPYGNWNVQYFRSTGVKGSPSFPLVNVSILARLSKNTLEDIRIAVGGESIGIIRNRKLEMFLVGMRLPLSLNDHNDFYRRLGDFLALAEERDTETQLKNRYVTSTMRKMLMNFIDNLILMEIVG